LAGQGKELIMSEKRSVFATSFETQALVDYLRKCIAEGIMEITYEQLSVACKKDVTASGRGNLRTAIDTIVREDLKLFATVRKFGVKLMVGAEVNEAGVSCVKRIRSASGRAMRKMAATDFSVMDRQQQVQHNALVSQLGTVRLMVSAGTTKKIESVQKNSDGKLTVTETIKLFS